MSYQQALKKHLAAYKESVLQISDSGLFKGKPLPHILPIEFADRNLFENAKGVPQAFPSIRRHRYFHHLNSSQALTFNLFFPYFHGTQAAADALLRALGSGGTLKDWELEAVPVQWERSNIDVCWRTTDSVLTFCEVKLSETEYGTCRPDAAHEEKRCKYLTLLQYHLKPERCEPRAFFAAYQFNRNLWHMAGEPQSRLMFLLPFANKVLKAELEDLLEGIEPATSAHISVMDIESVISSLWADENCPESMREYADKLRKKYVIGWLRRGGHES